MAISHADHDHPNTPAARAACRKRLANGDTPLTGNPISTGGVAAALKPAKLTVVPRTRGDGGVVKGLKATKPKPSNANHKKPGTVLRTIGDLTDVPRMLAYGVRIAWALEYPVKIGNPFNDTEARIVIDGPAGEIALVWRPSLPDGVWGIFFRPGYGSVTNRVDSIQAAFDQAVLVEDDE